MGKFCLQFLPVEPPHPNSIFPPLAREYSLLVDEHGRPRNTTGETEAGLSKFIE